MEAGTSINIRRQELTIIINHFIIGECSSALLITGNLLALEFNAPREVW